MKQLSLPLLEIVSHEALLSFQWLVLKSAPREQKHSSTAQAASARNVTIKSEC